MVKKTDKAKLVEKYRGYKIYDQAPGLTRKAYQFLVQQGDQEGIEWDTLSDARWHIDIMIDGELYTIVDIPGPGRQYLSIDRQPASSYIRPSLIVNGQAYEPMDMYPPNPDLPWLRGMTCGEVVWLRTGRSPLRHHPLVRRYLKGWKPEKQTQNKE